MSKLSKLVVTIIMVSSFAFSQQGQTLMNGGFSYSKASGSDSMMKLFVEYGGFVSDNFLLSGTATYEDELVYNDDIGGFEVDGDTTFELGVDYFITEKWHVGIRHNEGYEDEALRVGMFMPFKESGNVYLHPHVVRWLDGKVNHVNIGLSLWF